ncbi:GNAT family N-acetyltransferase [Amycolatopsis sp.]|uniref:GNAT family N-acetyltransferase n=1 Tax=Amycolatopsis sp. TaxID=37632 RepID=UPI002D7E799E|nr:GNAT family N-acetyltransferase [Amycolatopsis sp.]HET6707436.1 GNAT family N-acetyltransferase [Amycolatopsis sp.]
MRLILSDPLASFADVFTDIETDRLRLRPLTEADRQAMVDIHTDPRTNRFNPAPPGVKEASEMFSGWLAHWAEHGFGYPAVFERGGTELLGMCGVRLREFHGEKVLNLGYRFRPSAWGKGYAVEAGRAVLAWCARELPAVPVLASVSIANKPSLRVAEHLGFTEYTEEMYEGAMSRHYRR